MVFSYTIQNTSIGDIGSRILRLQMRSHASVARVAQPFRRVSTIQEAKAREDEVGGVLAKLESAAKRGRGEAQALPQRQRWQEHAVKLRSEARALEDDLKKATAALALEDEASGATEMEDEVWRGVQGCRALAAQWRESRTGAPELQDCMAAVSALMQEVDLTLASESACAVEEARSARSEVAAALAESGLSLRGQDRPEKQDLSDDEDALVERLAEDPQLHRKYTEELAALSVSLEAELKDLAAEIEAATRESAEVLAAEGRGHEDFFRLECLLHEFRGEAKAG